MYLYLDIDPALYIGAVWKTYPAPQVNYPDKLDLTFPRMIIEFF